MGWRCQAGLPSRPREEHGFIIFSVTRPGNWRIGLILFADRASKGLHTDMDPIAHRRSPVAVKTGKSGLALFESHHEEGFFMDWRRDSFAKILFVIGGEGTLFRSRRTVALQASTLLVIPPMAPHRIADAAGRPLSLVGICLDPTGFRPKALLVRACSRWRVETDSPLCRRIRDWLREILVEERLRRPGYGALRGSLGVRLLVELARTPARPTPGRLDSASRVEAYLRSLEREFWRDESLDEVAVRLGLSRRRFTQVFREKAGASWLGYVRRLRLEHAAQLLVSTRLSVRAIAFECGYADLSHFYRLFKEAYGTSPGRWRDG